MKRFNTAGFSHIHILVLIALIGILGGTGYFVYKSQNKSSQSKNQNTTATNSPVATEEKSDTKQEPAGQYDGWKVYTTKYEKMTFKYPGSYTLTDTSEASTSQDGVTPGTDKIRLKAPSGFEVSIQTGLDGIGGGCPECTIDLSEPVVISGANYFVNYVNNGSGKISSLTVSSSKNDFIGSIDGKNITIVGTNNKAATIISGSFHQENGTIIEKSLADYSAHESPKEFRLILQSINY